MALSDRTSELNYARNEGLQEGMETTARNALAKGLPIEIVHDITGLDIDTIQNLE
jgi:predicted transposase YdaD